MLASSRAIRAGERENSENFVVKIQSFPMASGALSQAGACNRKRTMRHTHSCWSTMLLFNLRKGEPKVESKTGPVFKGARSCHTLHHCQRAQCQPAPRSRLLPVQVPDLIQGYKGIWLLRPMQGPKQSHRAWRLKWSRCRGLGEICAGQTCLGRLAAAHGQITERNYSVAWLRLLSANY